MEWYYAVGDKQMGPVGDDEFKRLAADGTIRPDTLVWRAGMANWTAYRDVSAAAAGMVPAPGFAPSPDAPHGATPAGGSVVCRECGRIFAPEDVVRFGDASVCASCKPVYVQRMREGGAQAGELEYAGFWIRFLARVIDGIIVGVFLLILFFSLGLGSAFVLTPGQPPAMAGMQMQLALNGLSLLVAIAYNTLFVAKFGATPGKMAVRIRVVTAEGERLGFGRAFGRACADRLSAIICYIGYIIAAFDEEQKRSLHDHICSTRVIRN